MVLCRYETAEDQTKVHEEHRLIQEDMAPESRYDAVPARTPPAPYSPCYPRCRCGRVCGGNSKAAQMLGHQAQYYKIKGARRMTTLSSYLNSGSNVPGVAAGTAASDPTGPAAAANRAGGGGAGGVLMANPIHQAHSTVGKARPARHSLNPSAMSAARHGRARASTMAQAGKSTSFAIRGRQRAVSTAAARSRAHSGAVRSAVHVGLASSVVEHRGFGRSASRRGDLSVVMDNPIAEESDKSDGGRGSDRDKGGGNGRGRHSPQTVPKPKPKPKPHANSDANSPGDNRGGRRSPAPEHSTARRGPSRSPPGDGGRSGSPTPAGRSRRGRPLSGGKRGRRASFRTSPRPSSMRLEREKGRETVGDWGGRSASQRVITLLPPPPPAEPGRVGSARGLSRSLSRRGRGGSTRGLRIEAARRLESNRKLSPAATMQETRGGRGGGDDGASPKQALLAAGATGSQKKRRGSFAPPSPSPQPASPWREVDATPGYWQGEGEAAFKTTELVQTDSDGREWTVCFDHEGSKYYYAPDLDESRWVL